MYWQKQNLKIGITVASILFLLVLMMWIPASAVDARQHNGLATPATGATAPVQPTPTEDATVTALNKEKLAQEVLQLKNQNQPDLFGWLRTNASILLSTLVVVIGGLIGLFRWLGDRRSEREKRVEERFEKVAEGLGSQDIEKRAGAAVMLRTFLKPGYKQFYQQVFDLTVTHLRLPPPPHTQNQKFPDPLSQALIIVFKEAALCVRAGLEREKVKPEEYSRFLDASRVRLDYASLDGADLSDVLMREASLIEAHLDQANLARALLMGANLTGADLWRTNLTEASLSRAILTNAILTEADLTNAGLFNANPEDASSLTDTRIYDVQGLSQKQIDTCRVKGAIIVTRTR